MALKISANVAHAMSVSVAYEPLVRFATCQPYPWTIAINAAIEAPIFSVRATTDIKEKIATNLGLLPPSSIHDDMRCHDQKYGKGDVVPSEKTERGEPQFLIDCRTLTATSLRQKYKAEANSHRNMLQRAPKRGNIIHASFRSFNSFLQQVGPSPCKRATLDRINNDDLEYAPGKVRWADKRTQNSNKRDTLVFHCSQTKRAFTCSRLAKVQKTLPGTIRQRFRRGWTDDEIILGKRQRHIERNLSCAAPTLEFRYKQKPQQEQRPKTWREIKWDEDAHYAQYHRTELGEEYCIAGFDDLREILGPECGMLPESAREAFNRKFAKWWPRWKPHVRLHKLPLWAQRLVADIEGYSFDEWATQRDRLRDQL